MLYLGQEYQLGIVPECHYRYTGFVWIKHVHKGSTINDSDINFWNGFWMRYEWLQTFQSIWFARMVDYAILCQWLGPGMIFMSKEGIHVTLPRLARYIHTGEQLDIILKIGNLRGGIWFLRRSRVWLFLCNVSLNTVAVVYNTFLILIHFPHVFCRPHSFYHSLEHYLFGFKWVQVCARISKWISKFLHYFGDILNIEIATSFAHLIFVHGDAQCHFAFWLVIILFH